MEAATTSGFMYVKGDGIPRDLVARAFEASKTCAHRRCCAPCTPLATAQHGPQAAGCRSCTGTVLTAGFVRPLRAATLLCILLTTGSSWQLSQHWQLAASARRPLSPWHGAHSWVCASPLRSHAAVHQWLKPTAVTALAACSQCCKATLSVAGCSQLTLRSFFAQPDEEKNKLPRVDWATSKV